MKILVFAMLLVLAIPVAQAGLHLEPYVGYLSGKSKVTILGTEVKDTYKTAMIGARVGLGMMGVSAGVDYSMSPGTFELKQDTPATSAGPDKEKYKNLGIFVAFKFPVLFRVWGTYFLNSEMKVDTVGAGTGSSVDDKLKGKGFAVGAGFTGLPIVAINLEYRRITFDELDDGATGVTTSLPTAAVSEFKTNEVMLSISAPFNLF